MCEVTLYKGTWSLSLVAQGSWFGWVSCMPLPGMPFVLLIPTACPFGVLCLSCVQAVLDRCLLTPQTSRLIVVLAYWHATLYNLCLAESYCHAFFIPLKLKTSIYTYTLCYIMRLSCSAKCQFDSFRASPSTGSLVGARKTSWGLIKISLPGVTCLKQKPSAFCHQAKTLPALNMRHRVSFFRMKFKTASAIRCLEFSLVVKLHLTSIVAKL